MTRGLIGIRCAGCGNADPVRFHRIYVEASRERVVDGDWVVEEAWRSPFGEHADGQETYTVCDACGSEDVEETYGELADRGSSPVARATEILAEAVAKDGRLALLEDAPERGLVAVSMAPPGDPASPCDVFRVGVDYDLTGREERP